MMERCSGGCVAQLDAAYETCILFGPVPLIHRSTWIRAEFFSDLFGELAMAPMMTCDEFSVRSPIVAGVMSIPGEYEQACIG